MSIVPATVDELDEDWVSRALATPVLELEVEPLGADVGFLGDLARIRATTADGREHRLVAKLPTADPGGREVGRLLDVWRREHRFYTDLAAELTDVVPACVHAAADETLDRWVLLLEDLSPTRQLDQLAGASRADIELTVDALARLHARFDDRRGRTPSWVPGIGATTGDVLGRAVSASLPRWRDRFADAIPEGFAPVLDHFDLGGWLAEQARRPLVLAHADVRLDNLAFPTGGGVRLLDWQTAMRTNGVTDVAILLATSVTVDDRRAWEDELLERYAEGRAAHGAPVQGLLRRDYGESFIWWSAMFANNLSTIDPPPGRARDVFSSMVRRTATAALDHLGD